jgi:hypothetical protein
VKRALRDHEVHLLLGRTRACLAADEDELKLYIFYGTSIHTTCIAIWISYNHFNQTLIPWLDSLLFTCQLDGRRPHVRFVDRVEENTQANIRINHCQTANCLATRAATKRADQVRMCGHVRWAALQALSQQASCTANTDDADKLMKASCTCAFVGTCWQAAHTNGFFSFFVGLYERSY